jgi:hypothetical protein
MDYKILQLSQQLKDRFTEFKDILEKAVKSSDWNRIVRGHKKEGESIVDVAPYLSEHIESHQHYKAHLNDPKEHKAIGRNEIFGAAPKVIHKDVPEGTTTSTVMIKPFHSGPSSGSEHHGTNPHFGWATMAAKGLFNAAGMGDNAEDASVHSHQGIPVTIHRFTPGAKDWNKLEPASPWATAEAKEAVRHPDTLHDLGRGAILDFLMGSTDRHGGNLMYTEDIKDNRINPIYIDNERAFQYKNPMVENVPHLKQSGGPQTDMIAHHAIRQIGGTASSLIDEDRVRSWWDDHKHAIKDEFYRHLKNIKDPHIRGHIERNFNQRLEHVDDTLGNGVFIPWYGADPGVNIIKQPRKPSISTKQIIAQLPKDPLEALRVLDQAMIGKSRAVKDKLKSAQHQLVPMLGPQHLVQAYKEFQRKESGENGIPYDIASHLYHNGKLSGMKQMLDWHKGEMIKNGLDPEGAVYHHGVGLAPYWHERFTEKLKREK